MTKQTQQPTRIHAPHGATTTEISWDDGTRIRYPNHILRGYCPCAHCQGHSGDVKYIEGGNSELRDLELVGNYALKLVWGDGHNTGLYSFRHLRQLGENPACEILHGPSPQGAS